MGRKPRNHRLSRLVKEYKWKHVVYGLFDPRTAKCHYVGETGNAAERARQHCGKVSGQSQQLVEWMIDLRNANTSPSFVVLEVAESQWLGWAAEALVIGHMLRCGQPLVNIQKCDNALATAKAGGFPSWSKLVSRDLETPWTISTKCGVSVPEARKAMRLHENCFRVCSFGAPFWVGVSDRVEDLIAELSKREEASAA